MHVHQLNDELLVIDRQLLRCRKSLTILSVFSQFNVVFDGRNRCSTFGVSTKQSIGSNNRLVGQYTFFT